MKPIEELRSAFPKPNESFKACIRQTLDDLRAEERRPQTMKKTKLRFGVALAAVVLVLSTIVAGAASIHYGIFDFLHNASGGEVLPEAKDLVQSNMPQTGGQTDPVTFRIREAIYDGTSANLLIEAIPADDSMLLIGPNSAPEYPVTDLGLTGSGTVADYAAANGKTTIWSVSLHDASASYGVNSMDFAYAYESETGMLLLNLQGKHENTSETLPIELICSAVPVEADGSRDSDNVVRTTLSFELTNRADAQTAAFDTPTAFAGTGVTVERIDLKSTALGLYYTITYRVTDQSTFDALEYGLHFRFVDENGKEIPSSPAVSGSAFCADEANNLYIQEGALTAHETIPDSMTLTAVNIWTEDRETLDSHTFTR